jgi:AcrR family transcriptional regulator
MSEQMSARPLTFVEEARRRQIIGCTIELVSERGPGRTSLAGIAERAGISKAAVLYHFASKDAVMAATMQHVLASYAAAVGAQVDAADGPEAMLVAYLRGTVGYLREHPAQLRVLVEGLVRDRDGDRELRPFDARALALVIGGALDGVVAEWVGDRGLDLDAATAELETAVLLAVRAGGAQP